VDGHTLDTIRDLLAGFLSLAAYWTQQKFIFLTQWRPQEMKLRFVPL
jgi:hypothetical protein